VAWGVAGWPYCRSVATLIPTRGGGQQVAGRESERRRGEPSSTRVSSELETRVSSELETRVSSELERVSSELERLAANWRG
jgi:hypothetical protein